MKTMRAIAKLSEKANDISIVEVLVPEIDDFELLVSIKAIGVGIHDGYFFPHTISYPYPLGIEAAGIIEKVGKKVKKYQVGEKISFISSMQPKGGTWAEFAVVNENSVIIQIPTKMTFAEAAAVPVAGNTVLKALHALDLKPENSLFIAGASGAIGSFAIQLAVAKGCLVAGSASQKNHAYMHSLGAAKTVDYHDVDWTGQIKQWMPGGVDAAIAIQPGTTTDCMPLVKDRGRIVAVSGDQVSAQREITISQVPHDVDVATELKLMMEQIANKEFKLEIEQIYKFENGIDALKKTQTRHARGKLVLEL